MNEQTLKNIVEAALMTADQPLSLDALLGLLTADSSEPPDRATIRTTLAQLTEDYQGRGIELKEVASGYRLQVREEMSQWVNRLWQERPPRYSRALLETMAIIAYRQPVTRGEIEAIRGVAVSTGIIKTLLERQWIRAAGQRDVPGRPTVYVSTRQFLDYFALKSLSELPTLAEIKELGEANLDLFPPRPPDDQTSAQPTQQPQPDTAANDQGPVAEPSPTDIATPA